MDVSVGGGNPFGDIPTRAMRVKILYTFDNENKTNCLARFPDILQVPAVPVDENTQIGVIELRQCIQAIVSASPELISRLTQGDFTIYAYDYSEYETPLVGQGMLSSLLAASSPTPSAPAHQSKTMITGRVCKNIMALFNNGVSETLEVKLRLVPVPKPVQFDFLKSMEVFRNLSPAMSGGFDPNAWTSSIQQNQAQSHNSEYFTLEDTDQGNDQRTAQMVDEIFGKGSGSGGSTGGREYSAGVEASQTPTDSGYAGFNPAFATQSHSAPGSRAGSPIVVPESNNFNSNLRHQSFNGHTTNYADQSRPASRASVQSEGRASQGKRPAPAQSPQPTQQPKPQDETYFNEDGTQRKRAKVMQTDWRGRSSFGGKSSDLRVTAATAASVHMHRPIATKPNAPGSNLEPPPRVPTPVPQLNRTLQGKNRPTAQPRSLLRQASMPESEYGSEGEIMSDALMSSPEEGSQDGSSAGDPSPQDIPSSPPIFAGNTTPQPSSPGLPTLQTATQRMADSGYMSGDFANLDENEDCSPEGQGLGPPARYQSRDQQTFIKSEGFSGVGQPSGYDNVPGSDATLPLFEQQQRGGSVGHARPQGQQGNSVSFPPQPQTTASRPTLQHTATAPQPASQQFGSEPPPSRRGSLALPTKPVPAGMQVAPVQSLQAASKPIMRRAYTTANHSEAGSPAPSDTESITSRAPIRAGSVIGNAGSGTTRRRLLEQRLENCVARGEMPRFCQHCGAIETPTWRKIYVEEFAGKPSPLDYVEGENETIGVEIVERDGRGESTKYVIRKSMKRTKSRQPGQGAQELLVCNPCGLWFNKNKNMRPSDKWGRRVKTRQSKRHMPNSGFGSGFATDGFEPPSDAFFTDQIMPEEPLVASHVSIDPNLMGGPAPGTATAPVNALPPAPTQRPRANSLQAQQSRPLSEDAKWNGAQRDAALARAIQSSPARFQGSQQSPIEVEDLTPKPTRRLLFPSPRNEEHIKSLDDSHIPTRKSASPTDEKLLRASDKPFVQTKDLDEFATNGNEGVFDTFTMHDKENMPPPVDADDDDFSHLFDGSPTNLFKTPRKTPPSKQTPRASQRNVDNLLKTPTPASRKRKPLTPSAAAANNATLSNPANDFMTSPATARYFLRSTPTRAANTPSSRRSANNNGDDSNANFDFMVSPFSRHLQQMLSEQNNSQSSDGVGESTSPNRGGGFDFSDMPNFDTPGRLAEGVDWEGLEGLLGSSEFNALDSGDGAHGQSEGAQQGA
ncbi:hypothetical protein MBLNU230_g0101t1 [Neophaeotheca triangularis]